MKRFLSPKSKDFINDLLGRYYIKNVMKTKYQNRVLVSYLTKPFYSSSLSKHTNLNEVLAIVRVFHEMGFKVDVINYIKSVNFDLSEYDVVFGLGESVEYALRYRSRLRSKPFVIWHGTGSNPFYSNPLTIKRLNFTYRKTGMLFYESTRYLEKTYPLSYTYADLIVLYGNDFTKDTYLSQTFSKIETISPTAFFVHNPKEKDPVNLKNYVWFGSAGAIHKGLDLLIECFSKHKDLQLHICGDLSQEDDFYIYLNQTIASTSNIHYHGFIDVNSEHFKELMELGTFSILPSCSEGIATSVLTTMLNGGMIPIVPISAGIDLHDFGVLIDEISLDGIERAISTTQKMTIEEVQFKSSKVLSYSRQNFTLDNFKSNLRKILVKHL